jgi:hypothetical protein
VQAEGQEAVLCTHLGLMVTVFWHEGWGEEGEQTENMRVCRTGKLDKVHLFSN